MAHPSVREALVDVEQPPRSDLAAADLPHPAQGLSYVPYLGPDLETGARFPGSELVSAAVGLLPSDPRRPRDPGIRFRITVGPGVVAFGETGFPATEHDPVERGEVTCWSQRSRVRMIRTLAGLDYAPLFAPGRTPAMVTLTLPGDWVTVAPTGPAFKRLFATWRRRYEKSWGPLACVWKLEFQARGAPHLHLFTIPPHGERVCRCSDCGRPGRALAFRQWLSHSWADVVAHPDPEQRRRHLLAGTGIDYSEGLRASDPKRLAVYFAKHGGAGGGKEYQHQIPDQWRGEGNGPGRFWGVQHLRPALRQVDVAPRDWYVLRRTVRRWSSREVYYRDGWPVRVQLRTRTRSVLRGDRVRTVRRRRAYLNGSGGGFVLPNNGPDFVSALARSLALADADLPGQLGWPSGARRAARTRRSREDGAALARTTDRSAGLSPVSDKTGLSAERRADCRTGVVR